ncbi:MAG: hypothetical protein DLM63_09480, partial [Solirubrobacterales bacterium]
MLCKAAELEHTIMCQYLFAAFSLKQRTEEGLTEEELAAATRWRRVISHVASEEMLHLALVHNLLSAATLRLRLTALRAPAPLGAAGRTSWRPTSSRPTSGPVRASTPGTTFIRCCRYNSHGC